MGFDGPVRVRVRGQQPLPGRQVRSKVAMRLKLFCAAVIALSSVAVGFAIGQAQAAAPPTPEQLRQAVASLRGDRIWRPTSYDELTPEQKTFVNSILSG